jgi:hypothetical protein
MPLPPPATLCWCRWQGPGPMLPIKLLLLLCIEWLVLRRGVDQGCGCPLVPVCSRVPTLCCLGGGVGSSPLFFFHWFRVGLRVHALRGPHAPALHNLGSRLPLWSPSPRECHCWGVMPVHRVVWWSWGRGPSAPMPFGPASSPCPWCPPLHSLRPQPKEIKEIRDFLTTARRKDAKSVKVMALKTATKFKIRCSRVRWGV